MIFLQRRDELKTASKILQENRKLQIMPYAREAELYLFPEKSIERWVD
jgi:hypothetical protein